MKKITYLLATAALMTACGGNPDGFTITGSVEGGADGDTVYLMKWEGRQTVRIDSAVIADGTFRFKGVQSDSLPTPCYVTYKLDTPDGLLMPFFLERGDISLSLTRNNDSATGTPTNDLYQTYRDKANELNARMGELAKAMSDTDLTDKQKREKRIEMEDLERQSYEATVEATQKNIDNAVGIFLLKENHYSMDVSALGPLMTQIPAAYANDKEIVAIKERTEKLKLTSPGHLFTDFGMQTPEGKAVKLSDYVGKGKLVLVDFWASWCGPCRREMPTLTEAYKLYKSKGFEIVGVSLDRNAEAWKKGIKDLGIDWPQMSDLKFWDCEGAKLYGVNSIPHTVLIDRDGVIIARGLHGEELLQRLADTLE